MWCICRCRCEKYLSTTIQPAHRRRVARLLAMRRLAGGDPYPVALGSSAALGALACRVTMSTEVAPIAPRTAIVSTPGELLVQANGVLPCATSWLGTRSRQEGRLGGNR